MFIQRHTQRTTRRNTRRANSPNTALPASLRSTPTATPHQQESKPPKMVSRPPSRARAVQQFVQTFFYGSTRHEPASPALRREAFKLQHEMLTLQQELFADLYGVSTVQRLSREWDSDMPVVRYDKEPASDISSWTRTDRKDPTVLWLMGGIKSKLNDAGQVIPPGTLPADVWEEPVPVTLANLAYQHVMSINKPRFQQRLPDGASPEEVAAVCQQKREELGAASGKGSPLTSFTMRPPMANMLATWGADGQCVTLQGQDAKLIGPYRMAWMILEFANVDGIDDPVNFAWREDRGCFPDSGCEGVRKMERILTDIGIDPDGSWTRREKAVFYALVADEHLLIGVPPAGAAAVVDSRKAD